MSLQTNQGGAIMTTIVETPVESTTVADVLLGAIGLTAALVLAAVLMGGVLGGILIGVRKLRDRLGVSPLGDSESMRVTPSASTR